jgi:hypothetical protein
MCPHPGRENAKKMNRIFRSLSYSVIAASIVFSMVSVTDAQRRNDREIRDAVRSLNSGIDDFEMNLRFQMQSSSSRNADVSEAADHVRALRDKIRIFQQNYDRRRENRNDVYAIAAVAKRIELFLRSNPQNRRILDDWALVRRQIDRLGANYGVVNQWEVEEPPQNPVDFPPVKTSTLSGGLSGTYELDLARSESVDDIIADTRLGSENREDLKEKLVAPHQISIDIRGNQVTLSTSNAAPVTITADGRDKIERSPSGKTIRVRATLSGDTLVVSSIGGETDYNITFTSISDGRGMKVSRRITTDYLRQTVFAESVYNKTDSVALIGSGGTTYDDDDNGYSDNDAASRVPGNSTTRPAVIRSGNFIVPDGTLVTGRLENEINTRVSQNNDRFRLTVQSPVEFRGAVIEGYISGVGRSGKVTGRSNVTFNFERITLRDGKIYDFAGSLQGVKDQYGKTVSIDNEGTAKGDDQTRETAKRGGIGAGIGAVIGAIAGGAKGAAIGAVIGAGGGAGSVAVQGRGDVELQVGSTISIISSSPVQRDVQDR